MDKNAERAAILAAGYLLGRTKKMKLALIIAAGVAIGRLSGQDEDAWGPIRSKLKESQGQLDTEQITGAIGEAVQNAVTSVATQGVSAISRNLEERSANLRSSTQGGEDSDEETEESSADSDGEAESASSEDSESDDTEASEKKSSSSKKSSQSTKSSKNTKSTKSSQSTAKKSGSS